MIFLTFNQPVFISFAEGRDARQFSPSAFMNITNVMAAVKQASVRGHNRSLFFPMESHWCHPRVSRRTLRRCELTNVRLFMVVSESFMINCVKCGRQRFHTLEKIYTIPFLSTDLVLSDLSNGFGVSSAACLPGALRCMSLIYRKRDGGKKHMVHVEGEKRHESQRGLIAKGENVTETKNLQPVWWLSDGCLLAQRCYALNANIS